MYSTFIHTKQHGWCQPHVEQEQLYLPENLSSTSVFNTVRVAHLYFSVFLYLFNLFFIWSRLSIVAFNNDFGTRFGILLLYWKGQRNGLDCCAC
jgi:hypothetical protein